MLGRPARALEMLFLLLYELRSSHADNYHHYSIVMTAAPGLKFESLSKVTFFCWKTYIICVHHFAPVGQSDL